MKFEQLIREYTTGNYTFGFELECLFPKRLLSINKATIEVFYEIIDAHSLLKAVRKLSNDNKPVVAYIK